MRSIDLIINILADATALGKVQNATQQQQQAEGAEATPAAAAR